MKIEKIIDLILESVVLLTLYVWHIYGYRFYEYFEDPNFELHGHILHLVYIRVYTIQSDAFLVTGYAMS